MNLQKRLAFGFILLSLANPTVSLAEETESAPADTTERTEEAPKAEEAAKTEEAMKSEETPKADEAAKTEEGAKTEGTGQEAGAATAPAAEEFGKIGIIEEEGALSVNGNPAKTGDKVSVGDVLLNKALTSILEINGGGTLRLDADSQVTLSKSENTPKLVQLDTGRVFGALLVKDKLKKKGAKHRIMIRTSSAVMGVRGTEFLVTEAAGESAFHTVSGVVEVAKDEAALAAGQGVPVTAGNFVGATAAGLTPPAPSPPGALGALGTPPVPPVPVAPPIPGVPPVGAALGAIGMLNPFDLLSFEFGLSGIRFRSTSGEGVYNIDTTDAYQQIGGELAWTPMLRVIQDFFYFKGSVGAFLVGANKGHAGFFSPEAGLYAQMRFGKIRLEAGASMEWWEMKNLAPTIGAQLTLPLPIPVVDRLYVGVSQIYTPDALKPPEIGSNSYIHIEGRVGFGLTLPGL